MTDKLNWNDIEMPPPNGVDVEILYDNGNIAIGQATYYDFKFDKNKKSHRFNFYWDGGFLINETILFIEGRLNENNDADIIGWRLTHQPRKGRKGDARIQSAV